MAKPYAFDFLLIPDKTMDNLLHNDNAICPMCNNTYVPVEGKEVPILQESTELAGRKTMCLSCGEVMVSIDDTSISDKLKDSLEDIGPIMVSGSTDEFEDLIQEELLFEAYGIEYP